MATDEHLLSLLPELGASVTVPSFSHWVADVAVPVATGLWLGSACKLPLMFFLVYLYHFCDWSMQPRFHFRFFPGPACLRVFSSSLPSLFLCFPLPSFSFAFSFVCVALVFLSSSPLLVGRLLFFRVVGILGFLLSSPGLGFGRIAPGVCLCVGASARPTCFVLFCCVISLCGDCWGFGLPRVLFCPVLCVLSLF